MTAITVVFNPPQPNDPPATFDAKAMDLGNKLNPFGVELNALSVDVTNKANSAAQSVTDAQAQVTAAKAQAQAAQNNAQAAEVSATQAAKAANANATTWVPGGVYAVDDVVWAEAKSGLQLRCILAHSGITTPPANDPTRWVRVGPNSPAPDPTAGASLVNLQRDGAGVLTGSTFTQDERPGTETLTRDAQGRIATRTVVWSGGIRIETMLRDPTTGRLLGYALTGPNELTNSLFRPGSFPAEWVTVTGDPNVASIIAEPSAATGYVLRVGKDIGGNDCIFTRKSTLIEINDNALYRLRCRFRRVSGTDGAIYIGLACRNAENTSYINRSNAEAITLDLSHYAVNAAKPVLGVWQSGEYYYSGRSSGASTGAGTLSSPITFAALAKYFAIMHVANHNNLSGMADFDYLIVEEVKS